MRPGVRLVLCSLAIAAAVTGACASGGAPRTTATPAVTTAPSPPATASATPPGTASATAIATSAPTTVATPVHPTVTPTAAVTAPAFPTASVTPAASPQTVTLAQNGSALTLHVGDRFLLDLGSGFDWTVTVADPMVVSRAVNITVVAGAQGVYEAQAPGETRLSATGKPVCSPGQACPQFVIGFAITIDVR
jgi:hypothetical protein